MQIVPAPSALQVRKSGGGGLSSSAAGGAARAPGAIARAPIAHATSGGDGKAEHGGSFRSVVWCHQPTAAPDAAKPDQHPSTPVLTPVLAAASRERSRCAAQRPGVGSPNDSRSPPRRLRTGRGRVDHRLLAAADPTVSAASVAADARVLTMLDPFSSGQEVAAFNNEVARLSHGALRIRVVHGRRRRRPTTRLRRSATCVTAGPTSRLRRAGRGTNSALTACAPCTRRC